MGTVPQLPDVGSGSYLVEAFMQMKIATSTMDGLQPRSWTEVLAFAQATGAVTEPWELQLLFDMSWDYVNELEKSKSPFTIPPMERKQNG